MSEDPKKHNQPTNVIDREKARLEDVAAELKERRVKLLAAAEKVPTEIPDRETYDKVSKLIAQCRACESELDKERTAQKKPYDDLSKAVQQHFKPLIDSLAEWRKKFNQRVTDFDNREAKRLQEQRAKELEEARKKAESAEGFHETTAALAEQERAEAAAKDTSVRSSGEGYSTFQSSRRDFVLTDIKKLLKAIIDDELPQDLVTVNAVEVRKLITSDDLQDGDTSIPGIRVEVHKETRVRT